MLMNGFGIQESLATKFFTANRAYSTLRDPEIQYEGVGILVLCLLY